MIPVMIVPVLSNYKKLDTMINSINYPIRELLIIDNGAKNTDWQPEWNRWIHKTWHIKMPNNLGVAGSWNLGIKSTPMSNYWLISNFDVEWGGDSLKLFHETASSEKLVLSNGSPEWCAFTLGWKVVQKIGLFDEALHPAYFEDNDYERRIKKNQDGIIVEKSFIPIAHDNSSTLKSGYQQLNDATFPNNATYYRKKIEAEDYSSGEWSLKRRRANSWD